MTASRQTADFRNWRREIIHLVNHTQRLGLETLLIKPVAEFWRSVFRGHDAGGMATPAYLGGAQAFSGLMPKMTPPSFGVRQKWASHEWKAPGRSLGIRSDPMSASPVNPSAYSLSDAIDCEILVLPVSGGWSVEFSPCQSAWMFLSGAKAEEGARRLAQRIAGAGRDATVLIHDRRQMLVGTWRYFASDAGEFAPFAELPRPPPSERVSRPAG